jgi:hypothetical protein
LDQNKKKEKMRKKNGQKKIPWQGGKTVDEALLQIDLAYSPAPRFERTSPTSL